MTAAQTLTFLFTDIEGSTALLARLGDGYAEVLAGHHRVIRAGLAAHGGREIDTQGDAFFAVFTSPSACVAAAIDMQRALRAHPWPSGAAVRVRMGIHSGEAAQTDVGLVGLEVHRAARIAGVAHGGQILLSAATAALLRDSMPGGASVRDLGLHRLKDLGRPEQIFQLEADGLPAGFPPLASLDNPRLLNNLPAQVSSFIGRGPQLDEVRRLITTSRLVTLTGAGGAGKTRLALQAAAALLDGSGDGVWFVDLAPLQDGDLVAATLASVLGIHDDPDRRWPARWLRPSASGACWCCSTTASTWSTRAPSWPTPCSGPARTSCCWSARLHGAAAQALAALGETLDSLEARLRDLDRERLRATMGGVAFDAELAAGQAMTSREILDLALGRATAHR